MNEDLKSIIKAKNEEIKIPEDRINVLNAQIVVLQLTHNTELGTSRWDECENNSGCKRNDCSSACDMFYPTLI